jgi:hypothetical protein
MERVTGIEPAFPAWKAGTLAIVLHPRVLHRGTRWTRLTDLQGFNPALLPTELQPHARDFLPSRAAGAHVQRATLRGPHVGTVRFERTSS